MPSSVVVILYMYGIYSMHVVPADCNRRLLDAGILLRQKLLDPLLKDEQVSRAAYLGVADNTFFVSGSWSQLPSSSPLRSERAGFPHSAPPLKRLAVSPRSSLQPEDVAEDKHEAIRDSIDPTSDASAGCDVAAIYTT